MWCRKRRVHRLAPTGRSDRMRHSSPDRTGDRHRRRYKPVSEMGTKAVRSGPRLAGCVCRQGIPPIRKRTSLGERTTRRRTDDHGRACRHPTTAARVSVVSVCLAHKHEWNEPRGPSVTMITRGCVTYRRPRLARSICNSASLATPAACKVAMRWLATRTSSMSSSIRNIAAESSACSERARARAFCAS